MKETRKRLDKLMPKKSSKGFSKLIGHFALPMCKLQFCNPTCKDTVFEDKDGTNKIPPYFLSKNKKIQKNMIKLFNKTRKRLFGKKKSILKDDFYEGLPEKRINEAKKKGAISGCVEYADKKDYLKEKNTGA